MPRARDIVAVVVYLSEACEVLLFERGSLELHDFIATLRYHNTGYAIAKRLVAVPKPLGDTLCSTTKKPAKTRGKR